MRVYLVIIDETQKYTLLNETQEYSKRYPSLEPLLQSIGQKSSSGASAPTPAGPVTK